MATATVPNTFTIEPFDPTTTNWSRWLLRLEGAFRIFVIKDEVRVPYLLHYVGATSFDILCDRLAPQDPFEASYETLTRNLREFYDPAPLEIAENFKFHQCRQKEGESVQEFLAALHKLSVYCNFGDYLKTALRNQFVFGLANKRTQARLLEIGDLTLEKATQVATTMELSEKGAQQLQGKAADVSLLQATRRTSRHSSNVDKPVKCSSKSTKTRKPTGYQDPHHPKKSTNSNLNTNAISCYRCGQNHFASKCTLDRNVRCNSCGKTGHLKRVCFQRIHETNQLNEIMQLEHAQLRDKIFTTLQVNGKPVKFEIDSGAAVSVMSVEHANKLFPNSIIKPTELRLISYCKQNVKLLGFLAVTVQCRNTLHKLNLYITQDQRNALLGREWIFQLQDQQEIQNFLSNVRSIHTMNIQYKSDLKSLLQTYQSIMTPSISKIKGIQGRLTLKENAQSTFCKSRPVPFRLRPLIEKELQKLESEGVLEKVDTSEWATPIVPVLKRNGQIRICGDFSVTLNPKLIIDDHPLPSADELFASMAGGTVFSKIDLLQAYLQLEVRPEDRHYLTLNTHKGLYRPTRLMYGVASAPAIWQRTIENILSDLPGVAVFLDDIRIAGINPKDHLQKLEAVFSRLEKYNIRINLEKSEFFMKQINYCGYIIDKDGLHKAPDKVEAIRKMRRPQNETEVRSFLGMINYYGRFIKNLSAILHPLNNLLRKNTKFIWTAECERSFLAAKEAFSNPNFLVHFDQKLPLILATDASAYGVGAVLSHLYPDGTERVIQYASQTLSNTQKMYSQIDKEAYAIIFGIKKFYQFLHGGHFTLITDHRPLVQIFSPHKGLPIFSAMCMQHYALFLQGFNYTIKYRNSKLHANADCLSRLSIKDMQLNEDVIDVFHLNTIEELPLTFTELVTATKEDNELAKILKTLQLGKELKKNVVGFKLDNSEFTIQNNVILRGHRVMIPKILQKRILQELHIGHFGVSKMKNLARSYVWWSNINKDIEDLAKNCKECNSFRNNPTKQELYTWEQTKTPFSRVHADFAGPFLGYYFFILVDSFSKWPEVHIIQNITAKTTIELCRKIFATFGIPKTFVSDNGRTFISKEFTFFLKQNGIIQKLTAPYNPATNGQAERFVQTLKNSLRRMRSNKANVHVTLQQMLMQYRNMIHSATEKSPAELMFARKLRTRLDLLHPETINKKEIKFSHFNLEKGKRVSCRDYIGTDKWMFGKILERVGKLHYKIRLDDGRIWKRHINQMRLIGEKTPVKSNSNTIFNKTELSYSICDPTPPREERIENNIEDVNRQEREVDGPKVFPQMLPVRAEQTPECERDPEIVTSKRPVRPHNLPIRFSDYKIDLK